MPNNHYRQLKLSQRAHAGCAPTLLAPCTTQGLIWRSACPQRSNARVVGRPSLATSTTDPSTRARGSTLTVKHATERYYGPNGSGWQRSVRWPVNRARQRHRLPHTASTPTYHHESSSWHAYWRFLTELWTGLVCLSRSWYVSRLGHAITARSNDVLVRIQRTLVVYNDCVNPPRAPAQAWGADHPFALARYLQRFSGIVVMTTACMSPDATPRQRCVREHCRHIHRHVIIQRLSSGPTCYTTPCGTFSEYLPGDRSPTP